MRRSYLPISQYTLIKTAGPGRRFLANRLAGIQIDGRHTRIIGGAGLPSPYVSMSQAEICIALTVPFTLALKQLVIQ